MAFKNRDEACCAYTTGLLCVNINLFIAEGEPYNFHPVKHVAAKTQVILFTTGTLIRVSVEALHWLPHKLERCGDDHYTNVATSLPDALFGFEINIINPFDDSGEGVGASNVSQKLRFAVVVYYANEALRFPKSPVFFLRGKLLNYWLKLQKVIKKYG